MKKGLFVSICFPPKKDPECIQTARYFKYLTQLDANPFEVVTSKSPTLFMPVDEGLKAYDVGYTNKVEVPMRENRYLNFLIRKIAPAYIERPDSKFSFHLQWKKVTKQVAEKPDFIYSRSFPLSSTIMAMKLQQHYQIPWILHISDPWVDSPLHNWSEKVKAYHAAQESKCFEQATYICVTSQETLAFYRKKYKQYQDKFHYFPNVYDPDDLIENKLVWGDKLKIVYTGGLSAQRSAKPVLEAIDQLEQEASISDKVEFIFAGAMDRRNSEMFDQHQSAVVKHLGEVPLKDALALQKEAHVLINIDNPVADPKMAMFFPSKLLDYFLSYRKILAITSKNSATWNALSGLNHSCFVREDVEGIKTYIREAIKAYEMRDEKAFFIDYIPEDFSAKYNAERLSKLIESL